jgi:hypothetical protein
MGGKVRGTGRISRKDSWISRRMGEIEIMIGCEGLVAK